MTSVNIESVILGNLDTNYRIIGKTLKDLRTFSLGVITLPSNGC